MHVEIDSPEEFDAWVTGGRSPERSLARGRQPGVAVQGIDLTDRQDDLERVDVRGAIFLGCILPEGAEDALRARGALVFPQLPHVPFNPYRNDLHTAEELYHGLRRGYEHTPDARVYAWTRTEAASSLRGSLAQTLHDHAVTDALEDLVDQVNTELCVGIMGGHAAERGGETYRQAATLGAQLAGSGHVVMTGGGPGAMEAANLGARLHRDPDELQTAVEMLAEVPRFTPPEQGGQGITAWARRAMDVVERFPGERPSIGIPTWFYGHEPPNAFATHIAKYFSNALREDILLRLCRGGIIYLTGAAGTVQEIFQAATGNYYIAQGIRPTPMVLVGLEHWTRNFPAWPLLQALGRDRPMGGHIHLVDTVEEAWQVIRRDA